MVLTDIVLVNVPLLLDFDVPDSEGLYADNVTYCLSPLEVRNYMSEVPQYEGTWHNPIFRHDAHLSTQATSPFRLPFRNKVVQSAKVRKARRP